MGRKGRPVNKVKLVCPKCCIETWVKMTRCDICGTSLLEVSGLPGVSPDLNFTPHTANFQLGLDKVISV